MRIVVEHGASVHADGIPPLARAVQLEHAGIVDFLVKNGALTRDGREKALGVALEHGLLRR